MNKKLNWFAVVACSVSALWSALSAIYSGDVLWLVPSVANIAAVIVNLVVIGK